LAERIGGEVVGCDALQVYRGFDAATAKPSATERQRVPHHLIDHSDPGRDFTLADYVRQAEQVIAAIHERGRVPLVVGGTGLYLRGLLRGIVDAPARDVGLRERLSAMAARFGVERLHRWLGDVDPPSALRLAPGDRQRVIRALELALSGEMTWSERLHRDGSWATGRERYRALKLGLEMERDRLNRRLDERVGRFFASGLVDEVRDLLRRGVPRESNAFRAIGYREVLEALEQGIEPSEVIPDVQRNTRRYAKRQRSWFRGEPGVVWVDAMRRTGEIIEEITDRWAQFRNQ
jgi:tRNA dimethylallyltransferase